MRILDDRSLAVTVDRIADADLRSHPIPSAAAHAAVRWIVSRHGLPGAYGGLFAMTEDDWSRDLRLPTGERVTTRAGRSHILGEETARALLVLVAGTKATRDALATAWESMGARLEHSAEYQTGDPGRPTGEFCCATCSVAVWRHMAAGGFPDLDPGRWMENGVRKLARSREGNGWGRFPFHYTLLALVDMEVPGAVEEIRRVAPRLERSLRGEPRGQAPWAARRRIVAERALARC